MKKLMLLFAVSIVAFSSCEEEPACEICPPEEPGGDPPKEIPIADTYWAVESIWGDKYKLTFTSSTATYIYKARSGYTWIAEGSYTYDPPTIEIAGSERFGHPALLKGTVTDETLTIGVFKSADMVTGETVELKKQEPKKPVFPTEPTIIGEWRLAQKGDSLHGDIEMKPRDGMEIYTFKNNYTGWVYHNKNYHQESFRWQRISRDQIEVTGWRFETSDEIIVEPSGYVMSEEWTVQQLTIDELTVSYRMTPDPYWFDGEELPPPCDVVMTFERVE